MSLSTMQVFNEYVMPATIETLTQMVNKFNAASGGAIRLTTQGFTGDFLQDSFFAAVHSAQRRVNRYAAQAPQGATDLTQIRHSGVKVAGGFGPIRFEPSQLTWLQKPTTEGIEVASRNFAEALLADQLNTIINALVAAIANTPAATNDVSATAGIDYGAINNTHALFGDMSSRIVADVMNGATFHKLIGQNITNAGKLFVAGNVTVVDILNRAIVVTDAPALYTPIVTGPPAQPAKLRVLSLVDSAGIVYDGGDVISNIQTVNNNTRIETTLQMDYAFGVAIKGYTWNTAGGGNSPSDAALGTGANWVQTATKLKNTAGAIAIGDASK